MIRGVKGFAGALASVTKLRWSTDLYLHRHAAKQLMISGDGTGAAGANQGWVIGTASNNISGMWSSALSGSTLNSANASLYADNSGNTYLNGPTGTIVGLTINGVAYVTLSTSGLTYGTATGSGLGGATTRTDVNKGVTAFTDAVAKTVFTITIPNAAHSASILIRVTGSLGAGGAIGANEATATNCYVVTVTRTAGVNATAAISAAYGAAATAVAGAATVTCVATLDSVSGAVGASNTIAIQVTVTKSGGASDNHTCLAYAETLNANTAGITLA